MTVVPAWPLTSSVAAVSERPLRLRPFTATITSSEARPALAAGEDAKTCMIRSPRGSGATSTPMPLKLAGSLEAVVFRGGQVVREAVAETRHGARDRGVRELRFAQRAVVLIHHPPQRFVDDARVVIRDECAARKARQVFGVAPQPDACDQQHREHQRQDGDRGLSATCVQGPQPTGSGRTLRRRSHPDPSPHCNKVVRWPASSTSTVPANGLPVHRIAVPGTRALTVLVAFDAGARTERPQENGMAHFLEHLVFKGGEKYPTYTDVNETAERLGGVLNAYTSHDLVAFHITIRAESAPAGDRPAQRLRRTPPDRRRGARPRARRRDPGDQPRLRPALDDRRVPDRPRRLRRAPARDAPSSDPRRTCAASRARRSSPSASAAGRARAAARSSSATSTTSRPSRSCTSSSGASPRSPSPSPTCRRRRSRRSAWSSSARPTSRTCA